MSRLIAPDVTKGPWSLADDGYSVLGENDEYGNSRVADVVGLLADAKLIAAAPALANAGSALLDHFYYGGGRPLRDLMDELKDALLSAGYREE